MSIEEKKILLLETVVANQMQMIDLLNMLNHNVEELMMDVKEMKSGPSGVSGGNSRVYTNTPPPTITAGPNTPPPGPQLLSSTTLTPSSLSSEPQSTQTQGPTIEVTTNMMTSNGRVADNISSSSPSSSSSSSSSSSPPSTSSLQPMMLSASNQPTVTTNSSCDQDLIMSNIQQHLSSFNAAAAAAAAAASASFSLDHLTATVTQQQLIDSNTAAAAAAAASTMQSFMISNRNDASHRAMDLNSDQFKPIKTRLREFSTFVSKQVRQEFGPTFLALTRINDLDRMVMQRIKEQAVAKYLPNGVSPQLAWNHAMNSLRQMRHRQLKKNQQTNNAPAQFN